MGPSWRWFARTFGIAVVAHLAGNPPRQRAASTDVSALVAVSAAMGVLALVLIVRPGRWLLTGTAVLVLASVWCEAPFLSNHWLLMGFVAAGRARRRTPARPVAVALGDGALGPARVSTASPRSPSTTPVSSTRSPRAECSTPTSPWAPSGLPTVPSGSPFAWLTVIGPIVTETSVPLLLAFSRTRRAGVLLALCFHTVISIDLDQHFYDFTAVLVVVLCLFLDETTTADLEARAARMSLIFAAGARPVRRRGGRRRGARRWPARRRCSGCCRSWSGSRSPAGSSTAWPAEASRRWRRADAAPWSPSPGRWWPSWSRTACRPTSSSRRPTASTCTPTSPPSPGSPTTSSSGGRCTCPTSRTTCSPWCAPTAASSEAYADRGYLVPERNLLDYLARHPDASVVVRDAAGVEQTLTGADGVRQPLLVEKFQLFRAVDPRDPPRCQDVWLPAR